MTYLETLSKIEATMTRTEALTLVFHAESEGSQSYQGVRVACTEIGACGFTYDVTMEA